MAVYLYIKNPEKKLHGKLYMSIGRKILYERLLMPKFQYVQNKRKNNFSRTPKPLSLRYQLCQYHNIHRAK